MVDLKVWTFFCILYGMVIGVTLLVAGWGFAMASAISGLFFIAYFLLGSTLIFRDICKRKKNDKIYQG